MGVYYFSCYSNYFPASARLIQEITFQTETLSVCRDQSQVADNLFAVSVFCRFEVLLALALFGGNAFLILRAHAAQRMTLRTEIRTISIVTRTNIRPKTESICAIHLTHWMAVMLLAIFRIKSLITFTLIWSHTMAINTAMITHWKALEEPSPNLFIHESFRAFTGLLQRTLGIDALLVTGRNLIDALEDQRRILLRFDDLLILVAQAVAFLVLHAIATLAPL